MKNPCNCTPYFYQDPNDLSKDTWCHLEHCNSLKPVRKSWDQYFLDIATQVATRATCDRKHVGSVIVKNKTILATGYNGSIHGMPHCDDVGHQIEDGHCIRVVHSEQNAIIQAAKNGISIDGSSIYITCSPCWICFKMIVNAGIKQIIFGEFYQDEKIFAAAKELGVELYSIQEDLHIYY
jgi:dCMP deaminase